MMKRLISRLDIKNGRVIKGISFEGLRVVGEPKELAFKYYREGVNELLYIDTVASLYGRSSLAPFLSVAHLRSNYCWRSSFDRRCSKVAPRC